MKRPLVLIAILIISIYFPINFAHAAEFDKLNLPRQTINPGDFYYPFKRLWEKTNEKFQFSSKSKLKFYQSLLDLRVSELGYVVFKQRLGEVEKASQRLAFQAGVLTDYLTKYGTKEQKNETILKFKSFLAPLDELRDNFPANSSFWMLVQHDINSLKIYSEKLER